MDSKQSTRKKWIKAKWPPPPDVTGGSPPRPLYSSLADNLSWVRDTLGDSPDLVVRTMQLPDGVVASVLYLDGLVDSNRIEMFIRYSVSHGDIRSLAVLEIDRQAELLESILSGGAVCLTDGYTVAFGLDVRGGEFRNVEEPSAETVIRGPRESFTENMRTNTALIRRKIRSPNLWMEHRSIGRVTRTDVAFMYIKGLANDKVIEEVRRRLDQIDIDSVLESGYIEEMIQDSAYSPFPTIYNSERPDVIAAELLEGKIAILIDGTPFVLIVPALFVSFFHSAEDYYQRADISSLIRLLRFIGVMISLLAPSFYIAVTTFHHEMLPTPLLISLVAQREGTPFPAFAEALMMEITFEILREAGIRMPRAIGPAVSVVGTLVIGQAAVEAGFVSAAMVIVVSITAISSYVIPATNMSISFRMLRFPIMAAAASFGLIGAMSAIIVLALHLCSLRSFGVPYLMPIAPMETNSLRDTLFRMPHWMLKMRPRLISQRNIRRERASKAKKRGSRETQ